MTTCQNGIHRTLRCPTCAESLAFDARPHDTLAGIFQLGKDLLTDILTVREDEPTTCGRPDVLNLPCVMPPGHNRGHVDVPENHASRPNTAAILIRHAEAGAKKERERIEQAVNDALAAYPEDIFQGQAADAIRHAYRQVLLVVRNPPARAMSGMTDARLTSYLDQARAVINEYGHMLQGVFGSDDFPEFTYTIGLTAYPTPHPELIIVGLPPHIAAETLNALADRIRDGARFHDGQRDSDSLYGYDVVFRRVDSHHYPHVLGMGTRLFPNLTALQVVWPDRFGSFPHHADYELPPHAQPMLYA